MIIEQKIFSKINHTMQSCGSEGHPGWAKGNIGCKVFCFDKNYPFEKNSYKKSFADTQDTLQAIRDLYNSTDKRGFFFVTNRLFKPYPKIPITIIGIKKIKSDWRITEND